MPAARLVTAARLVVSLIAIALSANALATELLFAGAVQRQVVQPSGTPDCAPPCPAQQPPDARGMTRVCISNAGGCQMADIKVVHDFIGTAPPEDVIHIASRTGEWGQLHFPDSTAPLLVYVNGDDSASTPLTTRDGVDMIDARFVRRVRRVDADAVHPDADGRIPVAQLVELMRP